MPGQKKEQVKKKEILNHIKKIKTKDPKIQVEIQDLMFVTSVYISKEEKNCKNF